MQTQGAANPIPESPAYIDRSTGLIVFGIIEIIGGLLCALGIPFMLFSLMVGRKSGAPTPAGTIVAVIVIYAALAVMLITLGIGAAMAKRWARALNLILAWVWLMVGAIVTTMMVAIMPKMFLAGMQTAAQRDPHAGNVPPGLMAGIVTFMIVVMAVFLVLIPLLFLLFYRSRNVLETVRHRDPVERWTDRVPLPILAVSMLAAYGAVYSVVIGLTSPLFPFFGRYLTGFGAGALFLVVAVIYTYIAVSFYRLKIAGWWVALIATVLHAASVAITFGRASLPEAYGRMGWSPRQVEALQNNPLFHSGGIMLWSLAYMAAYLGFLLWVKKYFPAVPAYAEVNAAPPPGNETLG